MAGRWSGLGIAVALFLAVGCGGGTAAPASGAGGARPSTGAASPASAPAAPAASARVETSSASAPRPPISMTAAYGALSAQTAPTWLALEEGLFEKHGLNVNLIRAEDVAGLGSLSGGETHVIQLGGEVTMNAALAGGDYVFVGSLVNRFVLRIFGEKGLTDVQQLRGKTVAVNHPGTVTDVAFRQAMRRIGLTPDADVTFLHIGDGAAQFATVQQGLTAAVALPPPLDLTAEQQGYPLLLDIGQLDLPAIQSGYVTTRTLLQSNREGIKRYVAAAREGTQLCIAGDEACVRAIVKYSRQSEDIARAAMEAFRPHWEPTLRVNPLAISSVLETSKHPQAATARAEQFYDNSIVDELAAAAPR